MVSLRLPVLRAPLDMGRWVSLLLLSAGALACEPDAANGVDLAQCGPGSAVLDAVDALGLERAWTHVDPDVGYDAVEFATAGYDGTIWFFGHGAPGRLTTRIGPGARSDFTTTGYDGLIGAGPDGMFLTDDQYDVPEDRLSAYTNDGVRSWTGTLPFGHGQAWPVYSEGRVIVPLEETQPDSGGYQVQTGFSYLLVYDAATGDLTQEVPFSTVSFLGPGNDGGLVAMGYTPEVRGGDGQIIVLESDLSIRWQRPSGLDHPFGAHLAVSSTTGNIYVLQSDATILRALTANGDEIYSVSHPGLDVPGSKVTLAPLTGGHLLVAAGPRVLHYDATGTIVGQILPKQTFPNGSFCWGDSWYFVASHDDAAVYVSFVHDAPNNHLRVLEAGGFADP